MKHYFKVLVSFLVVSSFAVKPGFAARILDRTLVVVNDEAILDSDVDRFMEKLRSKSFQELFGGVDTKAIKDREAALQLLVEERLVNQQVKKLELQATDQEVDGQIRTIVKRNGITVNQLEQRLKQLGTTMTEYKDGIRRQIERRNLIDREIKPSMEVTEEQLRHFFIRNQKPEDLQHEYKIAHILITKKAGSPPPLERAKAIYSEIKKKPEEFARYAKEVSDDSTTAPTEGLLGYFSLNSLSKELRAVVPKTPAGEITEPIKTAAGYHIVKVLEVKEGDFASMPKERREALKNMMLSEELEKKMALWIERKKAESTIHRLNKKN